MLTVSGKDRCQWLKDHGMRATPQRVAILEALECLPHPDAEAIHRSIQEGSPGFNLATVYNTLERFRENGLVQVVDVEGRRHYDLRGDRHDHLFCRRCGSLVDVNGSGGGAGPLPEAAQWAIEAVTVVWRGLCPNCRQESSGE